MKWVIRHRPDGAAAAAPRGPRAIIEQLETRRLLSAAITGFVFNDANANGLRDPGEGGLPRPVYIDANANGTQDAGEAGATVGADGTYTFADLAPGTYLVRTAAVNDFVQTYPGPAGTNAGHAVTVAAGQTAAGFDFGAVPSGALPIIHGAVFRDTNEDGVQDAGESNLANYTVYLDANDNGQLDAGERTSVTGTNGYGFTGLLPGTYVLRTRRAVQQIHVTSPAPADDAAHFVNVTTDQHDNVRSFGVAPVYPFATFSPIYDAYVRDGDGAATNYGTDPQLIVQQSDVPGSTYETYVRLDAANYPDIRSFKLRLYGGLAAGAGDGPVEIAAYAQGGGGSALYNWNESSLTWDTRPGAADDTPLANVTVSGTDATWYELDLSGYVAPLRAAGQFGIPIVLKARTAGGRVAFASRNNPDTTIRARQVINEDLVPPAVTQVLAGGSGWAADFKLGLRARDLGAEGFVLPPGGAANPQAPRPLPWTNVNQVRVRFNEYVTNVNTKALVFQAPDGTRVYPSDARLEPLSLTATWTFARPLAAGRYTVDLDRAIVKDASGNALAAAGAWVPLQLNVLPGDADRDGRVASMDLYEVVTRLGRTAAAAAAATSRSYLPFADVTADGRIDGSDYAAVRTRLGAALPPASTVTPTLFARARITRASALVDSVE